MSTNNTKIKRLNLFPNYIFNANQNNCCQAMAQNRTKLEPPITRLPLPNDPCKQDVSILQFTIRLLGEESNIESQGKQISSMHTHPTWPYLQFLSSPCHFHFHQLL
jgi:hypothetical protein